MSGVSPLVAERKNNGHADGKTIVCPGIIVPEIPDAVGDESGIIRHLTVAAVIETNTSSYSKISSPFGTNRHRYAGKKIERNAVLPKVVVDTLAKVAGVAAKVAVNSYIKVAIVCTELQVTD